jgi:hypothetical protein
MINKIMGIFKEWLLQIEVNDPNQTGYDQDTGQVYNVDMANRYKAMQSRKVTTPQDPRVVVFQASQNLENWLSQPQVLQMLLADMNSGKNPAENKGFLGFLKTQNFTPNVSRKLAMILQNRLAYYAKVKT